MTRREKNRSGRGKFSRALRATKSVGLSVSLSVCHNFLKGREVAVQCSAPEKIGAFSDHFHLKIWFLSATLAKWLAF